MSNLLKLLILLLYLHDNVLGSAYQETEVGNLLVGREERLFASSTCGLKSAERYCVPSETGGRIKCFQCDSREATLNKASNHGVGNVLRGTIPGTKQTSWWQSKNGVEHVHLQLDLEAQLQIVDLNMTFKEPLPAEMLVELSTDFGRTWRTVSYFSDNCSKTSFPICNPISKRLGYKISAAASNLRINFTEFREIENVEARYYAVTELVVEGTCHCHGNSNECTQASGNFVEGMVGSGCNCVRNTGGPNCERCKEAYRLLGSPRSNIRFECVACNCDPIGSLTPNCEPLNGHCFCKPSFKGKKCDLS